VLNKDLWHYRRTELAQQIVNMFATGLSSALVFFAPRRMGKTEFLAKDITPYAKKHNWQVCYFSFLDTGKSAKDLFTEHLIAFAESIGAVKNRNSLLNKIKKISASAASIKGGVELRETKPAEYDLKKIIACLAKKEKILLLMDEVQVLAKYKLNEDFIASFRTALDLNKDQVKVIFTGSSRKGLQKMFSQANAPFFHFGQNLPFPEFNKEFTDHLADVFYQVSNRQLDKTELWEIFLDLQKVPQLIRSLVERAALNPNLRLQEIKKQLLEELVADRKFAEHWEQSSALEKLLLLEIVKESKGLFSEKMRRSFAKQLGIETLEVPAVQSALRALDRKELIGNANDGSGYFIEDPNFESWLAHH
jgi:ATP:corrinoid adenosyltransferase